MAGHPQDAADHVLDPEVPASTVFAVVNYMRLLAPPAPGHRTRAREQGSTTLHEHRLRVCAMSRASHRARRRFPRSPIVRWRCTRTSSFTTWATRWLTIGPMRQATGREWRTTPLWGLRLIRQFLNGEAFLLHDGRARTIEEAILLHGGEAQRSRDLFNALNASDRARSSTSWGHADVLRPS
jgi:hypothetical protein